MRLALFTVVFALFPLTGFAQAPELDGPYPANIGTKPSRAVAYFGFGEDVPRPIHDSFARMTFLGTEGFTHGSLMEVDAACIRCGEEREENYYNGKFALDPPAKGVGKLIAAIPGIHQLGNYEALALTPLAPAEITASDTFSIRLGPERTGRLRTRIAEWDAKTRRMKVESKYRGETSSFNAEPCNVQRVAEFKLVECKKPAIAMLLHGSQTLLLSRDVCGDVGGEATPIATFELAGTRHYVVRFGRGAHKVIGLLFRTAEDGWQWRSRLAAYYSSC